MTITSSSPFQVELRTPGGNLVAVLENAFEVGVDRLVGASPMINFSLPADDPKIALLASQANEVWVSTPAYGYIGSGTVNRDEDDHGDSFKSTFEATGFMAQLADEYITSYASGYFDSTTTIISALLALQVNTYPIQMGTFEGVNGIRYFTASNCSVLKALQTIMSTYQTGTTKVLEVDQQRRLNVRVYKTYSGQQLRYRKNMRGIKRVKDYSQLANRIYAYGTGTEGARVKLSDSGGIGQDYVEDTVSQAAWTGGKPRAARVTDDTITTAQILVYWAQSVLAQRKDPVITYTVDAIDLAGEAGFSFNNLNFLDTYEIIDEDLGISVATQIVRIHYADLANPLNVEIELSNKVRSITDSITDLALRK